MGVEGIDYLYLETRNWGKSVKFWQELGYSLVLDLGSSGRLEPTGGGAGIFLQEVSPEKPLTQGVYLKSTTADFKPEFPGRDRRRSTDDHWGAQLMTRSRS